MEKLVQDFIQAANAPDIEAALGLFADDAMIDDRSVGDTFAGKAGIGKYLEAYFVRYHTVTALVSLESVGDRHAKAHVDFTGDFGHETGVLEIRTNAGGLIERIDADLD
ncbi:MAG: nuclear transport factor 2 family protein [Proteobacteria bacterium]|nr:nuclear transport factor 2 family protein [Pseudomonadota bacterium]